MNGIFSEPSSSICFYKNITYRYNFLVSGKKRKGKQSSTQKLNKKSAKNKNHGDEASSTLHAVTSLSVIMFSWLPKALIGTCLQMFEVLSFHFKPLQVKHWNTSNVLEGLNYFQLAKSYSRQEERVGDFWMAPLSSLICSPRLQLTGQPLSVRWRCGNG